MFSNAGSINFRGKKVKQIVRIKDNAILYQKENDNVRLILEIKEYLGHNGIPGFKLTFKTEDNKGNFVPFRTDNLTFYKNNEVLFSIPGANFYEPQSLDIEEENFFNIGDEIYISVADQNLTSNTVTIRGDFMEYVEITFNGEVLTQNSNGSFSGTDMVIDYGDGTIETTTGTFGHTYSENESYTIKIYKVTGFGSYCFYDCAGLTSINIPNSVISFGSVCFARCANLTSINIPNSVTSLSDDCFVGCANLTSINIPNNITSLGNDCFFECTGLTSVIIPNNVINIGAYCFFGCTNLTSIILNWTTSNQIVAYNSNWITSANANLKFEIPEGTTDLYIEKGYPSNKLVEISSDETMDISVSVVYDNDNNNQDGNRPTEIPISLTVSGETIKQATITAENNWTYTFSGLLIEDGFSYQIVSDQIDYYLSNVDRVDNEFIITETYSPPETYSSIRIEFDNDTSEYRPESIMATLNNGMTVTLTEQNGWAFTIYNLPSIINHEPMTYDWNIEDISYYQISQKLNFNEYLTIFTLKLETELPSTGGLIEIYAPSFTEDNPTPTNSLDSGYQVSQSNGELTLIGGCISDGWSNDDLWQCDYDVKWNGTRYQWFRTLMALPNTALLGGWEGCLVNPQPGLGSNVQRDNTDCLTVVHENIWNNPSTPWIHITITKVSPTTLVVTKSGDTTNNGTVTFTNCELLSSYEKMSVGALSNNGRVMGKPTFKNFKVTKPKVIKDDVEDGEELG